MTPGGPCFQCREFTGRHDPDRRRWACSLCWPEPLGWELSLAALHDPRGRQFVEAPVVERLPGETRQEWRRRSRAAGGSA